jgi:hypothetical protein
VMMDLHLTLEFACCECEQPVHVTVHCSGKKPAKDGRGVARVNVPCPTCGQVNQVSFEPSGTVRAVQPHAQHWPLPGPSVN